MHIRNFQKIRIAVLTFSTILFPFTFYYLSPVVSMYAGSLGIVAGSIIVFALQLATAVVFGRSFCSWICPAGGIQDQVMVSRSKRVRVRRVGWMKYAVWIFWIGTMLYFFGSAGGMHAVEFGFSTDRGLSTTSFEALVTYGIVVSVFFVLSIVFGRRAGCHTICWMAPFMVIGRRIGIGLRVPSLRLRADPGKCVSCGRCTERCPMSLEVEKLSRRGQITNDDCILCGQCIAACRSGVIRFAWRNIRSHAGEV